MNRKLSAIVTAIILVGVGAGSLLFTASAASKEKPCGMISYMVGSATVTRAGKTFAAEIATPIYNNDLIQTKAKSRVDVDMDKSTGFSGTVKVAAATSFYFKVAAVAGEPATALELMSGAVGMKVAKLAGSPSAQIRTDGAVCGVRGTGFNVTVAPTGDMLVTCEEGKVGLYGVDDDGQIIEDDYADVEPGVVVQRLFGQGFAMDKKDVADLESFEADWMAKRLEVLKADPRRALADFAGRYLKKLPAFNKAVAPLEASAAFRRWQTEESEGVGFTPTSEQNIKDNREISPFILSIRKEGRLLERWYFRIEELRGYLEGGSAWNQSLGIDAAGNAVKPGDKKAVALTPKTFFQLFDRDRKALQRQIQLFHEAERLQIKRNPFGASSRPGADSSAGSFFGDSGSEEKKDGFFD